MKTTQEILGLPFAELKKLEAVALVGVLKDAGSSAIAQTMRMGKVIVALEPAREASGEKTISKFLASQLGVEIARDALGNAYKTAIVFASLVTENPGPGEISEAVYDRTSSRLCRPASAILNALADKPADFALPIKAEVATIIIEGGDSAYEKMEKVKERILPKAGKKKDSTEGAKGESSANEKKLADENAALKGELEQARENGRTIMRQMQELTLERDTLRTENAALKARIAQLEASADSSAVATLTEITGMILTLGEDAMKPEAKIAERIASLPEAVRAPIEELFNLRLEASQEQQLVAA